MMIYQYSVLTELIYRYGNIPITLLLLIYLTESVVQISSHWYSFFFVIINIIILVALNRYYFKSYRSFGFRITVEGHKLICENYFMSRKKIEIDFSDIKNIEGGIFSGRATKPIYLFNEHGLLLLGFYSHVGNFSKLLETILKNIDEDLYQLLLSKMKNMK